MVNTSGQPRGGWLHGEYGNGEGAILEIVPFAHGYERAFFHCWALSGGERVCQRRGDEKVHWRVGMWLCWQHYLQLCRNGPRIVRLPRPLLERLLAEADD